ncbi:hypothetical protein Barb6XT_02693 [Bacteroidales bacterium Barb6XT]|nr:hypothetical protein Barb6XT_02693 [Bacteroidales bacterium Barb6XT]
MLKQSIVGVCGNRPAAHNITAQRYCSPAPPIVSAQYRGTSLVTYFIYLPRIIG